MVSPELGCASALRGVRAQSRFVDDAVLRRCWIRASARFCEWSGIALTWSVHEDDVSEAIAALGQNETSATGEPSFQRLAHLMLWSPLS